MTVSRNVWYGLTAAGLLAAVAPRSGLAWKPEAQDPPVAGAKSAAPSREADAASIRAVTRAFVEQFNKKNAAALGSLFTEAAEIEDEEGEVVHGREAIVARYAETFADGDGGELGVEEEGIRFLGPNLAIEAGRAAFHPADGGPTKSTRYTVLYEKIDGKWLQARVEDEASEETTPAERLAELDWMIGEWVNESDNGVVTTACKRSPDGNFLLREFDVKIDGGLALSGVQRIGWDSLHKQFRTWIFDSEGGFGEGTVSTDGEGRWIVKVTGVRADGRSVTATTHLTRLSKDRVSWASADRTVGGISLPEGDHFTMVRRAPAPASKK